MHNHFGKKGGDFVVRQMNDMTTEQVESIAKQFKRGAVGTAAFLIGAYAYKNLGGFNQEGKPRKPEELQPEEIKTNVGTIPKEFVHHPMFTVMQAGAATMQIAESQLRKKDEGPQGIGSGALAAAAGVAEQAPMIGAARSVSKLFNPYTRMDAIGSFSRTMLGISGPVSWLAKHQDTSPEGIVTKRRPRTFGEELKIGIPGLRKTVPEASELQPPGHHHK